MWFYEDKVGFSGKMTGGTITSPPVGEVARRAGEGAVITVKLFVN